MGDIAADKAGRALLEALFGNSAFLGHLLLIDPEFACALLIEGPDRVVGAALDAARSAPWKASEAELMQELRRTKRRSALGIAVADITGAWPLERVTGALSRLADASLSAAVAHLLHAAARRGEIGLAYPDDPARESGLIILGLGKLGGDELNYSSDIDLMVLYEHGEQQFHVRLARNLVRLLEERTADGYVFRTDLRLRPDPGATPLALSTTAAEIYYESAGQNWERAAMIKARPSAGDLAAGGRFVKSLRPFIWRKNLDFEAIKDIHSIKRQIHAHRGGAAIAVGGHNIKLGRGGIREIEFFVQTQQLIWGGRRPALRTRSTVEGLARLVEAGLVTADATAALTGCYRYLRTLEHRLQMQDDRQTQTLPADSDGLDRIAAFMGAPDRAAFESELVGNLRAVELHYARLFEEAPDLTGPGNLVFTGIEDDPDTVRTLREMGYAEPQKVGAVVRAWHHGRYRAMRSTRARQILTELMPALLQAFARTVDPDTALARFDEVLARLPAGVQLFSLFLSNPSLLELVAEIAGSAPRLADQLARSPQLLDGVLQRDFYAAPPAADVLARDLADQLGQARDFQDTLDIARRWNNDRVFQVGIHILRDLVDPEAAAVHLTAIADAALTAVLAAVEAEIVKAHGRVPGGGFAIIGMGKLGGAELTVGADLDLLFIYDAPQDAESSDGEKPLPVSQYYTRLAQRFIAAVTAPTSEGKLYDIDMRLRPSGNAGPIATSLEAFGRYQRESAWTWEHMALTRARVIAGPAPLAARFMDAVRATLATPRDPDKLLADVADMRTRMVRELGSENLWNAKHVRGGFVDIEFIAQYLELKHAHARPEVLSANTADAVMRLANAGFLDPVAADQLTGALHLWRRVQGMLRLTIGTTFDEASAPRGLKAALARTVGAVDFAAARGIVAAAANAAHARFIEIIEAPAADIAARSMTGENKR